MSECIKTFDTDGRKRHRRPRGMAAAVPSNLVTLEDIVNRGLPTRQRRRLSRRDYERFVRLDAWFRLNGVRSRARGPRRPQFSPRGTPQRVRNERR